MASTGHRWLALIVFPGTTSFAENWVLVMGGTPPDGGTAELYVDTDSIRLRGDYKAWIQDRYSKSQAIDRWIGECPRSCQPSGSKTLCNVSYGSLAIDCARSTFASTSGTYNSADGRILQTFNIQRAEWTFSEFIPGTGMAKIRDLVCEPSAKKSKPQPRSHPPITAENSKPEKDPKIASTGTGFDVSAEGHTITNAHVVNGCREVRSQGGCLPVITVDTASDLALLSANTKSQSFGKIRSGRGPRPGEEVVALGFPLTGLLSSDPIVTTGIISALAGIKNDRRFIQITVPVQPGNSGGPLLGANGAVVGVMMRLPRLSVALDERPVA